MHAKGAACLREAEALQVGGCLLGGMLHPVLWHGAQHLAEPPEDVVNGVCSLIVHPPLGEQLSRLRRQGFPTA